jgi:hypothetical protein
METITAGQSASFTIDAFGYITIVARGEGALFAGSRAQNLKSNVSVTKLASTQYGPYGVPMDVVLNCTNGSIEYAVTDGFSSSTATVASDPLWDATGDLVYATGANAATRLPIGTAGQILTVGGSSMPEWATPATASSNAGIATSSGSDLTAMSAPSGVVTGYTAGADYEVTRDVNDVPTSLDVVGTTITSALTRVGTTDYYYINAGSPYYVGGAKSITLAQMREWETAALASLTTIKPGYRVWVSNAGSWTSPSNVTTALGALAVWTAIGWMWETSVIYRTDYVASYTGSTSQSAALAPLTIPAGIMGALDTAKVYLKMTFTNLAGTKSLVINLNGGTFLSVSAIGATVEDLNYRKSLRNKGLVTAQDAQGSGNTDVTASSSSAQQTYSINTSTTELLFEPKITPTNSSDVANVIRHTIVVTSRDPAA